tara:strand:+ start:1159 stop:1428 length:270 start_codon:yes stop_codon:yes gene_type:complete
MKSPIDIKDMTNEEFMSHLMTGYSKHGPLVQMVVLDCLQKGLNEYIENEDMILEEEQARRGDGRISLVNMEAWVACCKETLNRIEEKYS